MKPKLLVQISLIVTILSNVISFFFRERFLFLLLGLDQALVDVDSFASTQAYRQIMLPKQYLYYTNLGLTFMLVIVALIIGIREPKTGVTGTKVILMLASVWVMVLVVGIVLGHLVGRSF